VGSAQSFETAMTTTHGGIPVSGVRVQTGKKKSDNTEGDKIGTENEANDNKDKEERLVS